MHRAPTILNNLQHLVQVILQLAAAAGMAQFAQGLGLNLTDALAGDVELFAHFLQRAAAAIVQAEAQLQHFALALGQAIQHIFHLLLEKLVAGGVGGSQRGMIFDEVAQVAVVLFANGRFEADRLLADFYDLAHFLRADLHLLGNLFRRRLAAQVLQQTTADADQAVDRLYHVDGNTNRAGLVGDSAGNRLANPPRRIGAELVALRVIEFLDRANQADVALLDQVQQTHAPANILFRYADDQAQVGLGQAALSLLTIFDVAIIAHGRRLEQLAAPALHTTRQAHFLLCGKQGNAPDLAQVHAHGIVEAALDISNHYAQAIMQVIPLAPRKLLDIHFILWPRLPPHRWLFGWIQGIHRFLVLYLEHVKRLSRINRSYKAASRGCVRMTTDRAKSKKTIRAVQRGVVQHSRQRSYAEQIMQRFRVHTIMVY